MLIGPSTTWLGITWTFWLEFLVFDIAALGENAFGYDHGGKVRGKAVNRLPSDHVTSALKTVFLFVLSKGRGNGGGKIVRACNCSFDFP